MGKFYTKYELHELYQSGKITFTEFERLAIFLGYLKQPIDEVIPMSLSYEIDLSQYTIQQVNNLYIDRTISHQEYMAYLADLKQQFVA